MSLISSMQHVLRLCPHRSRSAKGYTSLTNSMHGLTKTLKNCVTKMSSEKKIDRIEDRLAGIEHVLEALSNKLGNLDLRAEVDQSSQSRSRISTTRSPRSGSEANVSTPAPFEGETTIIRQSEFARELLEQAVGSTPSIIENAEVKAALTSLQDMVTRQGAYTNTAATSSLYPFINKSLANLDHTKLERPPWELVNEVIDKTSVYPTMSFAVVFPFLKMPNMKQVCREAFEHPEDCGIGRRMLVYGVLASLFQEFSCYPVVDKRWALGQSLQHED